MDWRFVPAQGSKAHSFKEQIQTCGAACKTSFRVSTREVYQNIDSCSIEKRPDTDMLVKALRNNSHRHIYSNMINDAGRVHSETLSGGRKDQKK